MPKAPPTAYFLFYQKKRLKLLEKNPSYSQTELAKALGLVWRELTDKEKDKYVEMRKKLKLKYDQEMEEFYKDHPDAKAPSSSTSNAKTDSSKSKDNSGISKSNGKSKGKSKVSNKIMFTCCY